MCTDMTLQHPKRASSGGAVVRMHGDLHGYESGAAFRKLKLERGQNPFATTDKIPCERYEIKRLGSQK